MPRRARVARAACAVFWLPGTGGCRANRAGRAQPGIRLQQPASYWLKRRRALAPPRVYDFPCAQVWYAMQGEMSAMVTSYPKEHQKLLPYIK